MISNLSLLSPHPRRLAGRPHLHSFPLGVILTRVKCACYPFGFPFQSSQRPRCVEEVSFSPMAKILVHGNEAVKDALRRFKKLCDREGIVNRSKRVARFEKPSVRRRRRKNERLKNIRKGQKTSR